MTNDDVADWEMLLRGDQVALARVFDRHEARVFRHASRLLSVREDETARALGIPVGTVKSRLFRAKSRLRGELDQIGFSR